VQKVIDLVKRFAELFDGQFEYGHDYTMQQLQQCAAHASPFFCATYFYFQVGPVAVAPYFFFSCQSAKSTCWSPSLASKRQLVLDETRPSIAVSDGKTVGTFSAVGLHLL
jgi:hypothetical protein